jgi:hypothetical protein
MKPDDNYSEWDDFKFGCGFIALVLFTIGCIVVAIVAAFI